jgi:riboflavin synthase
MKLGDRLDGHIVQGHVDQTGTCITAEQTDGSWRYTLNMTITAGFYHCKWRELTVVDSAHKNAQRL